MLTCATTTPTPTTRTNILLKALTSTPSPNPTRLPKLICLIAAGFKLLPPSLLIGTLASFPWLYADVEKSEGADETSLYVVDDVRKGILSAVAPMVVSSNGCRESGMAAVRVCVFPCARGDWWGRRRDIREAGEEVNVRVEVCEKVRPSAWMLQEGGGRRAGRRSMVAAVRGRGGGLGAGDELVDD